MVGILDQKTTMCIGGADFQRMATEQGQKFEEAVELQFQIAGCVIVDRKRKDPASGEEIDHVIQTPKGHEVWVESKGSWQGDRPGLIRSDTAKKAVATAWNLKTSNDFDTPPYVLVGSHLPKAGSYPEKLLGNALRLRLFDWVIQLNDIPATIKEIDEKLS